MSKKNKMDAFNINNESQVNQGLHLFNADRHTKNDKKDEIGKQAQT